MSNIKEEIYEIALTESQMECDELKAHIERLREVVSLFVETYMPGRETGVNSISMPDEIVTGCLILSKTPAQSLNHIKAQAIEEYQNAIKIGIYYIDSNVLDIGDDFIAKYKEKSDD